MAGWQLRITGASELARRLRTLADGLTDEAVRKALVTAAEPMRARMAQLAPRGPEAPHLADSMVISRAKTDEGDRAVAVGPAKDFFYGSFLEFGTKHMSARAFARPAFDSEAEACLAILARELWAAVSHRSPGGTGTL